MKKRVIMRQSLSGLFKEFEMRTYIILSLFFISGCMTQYLLPDPLSDKDDALRHVNNDIKNRIVSINLRDHSSFNARRVKIALDTTFYVEVTSESDRYIPNSLIANIEYQNSTRGALDGLYVGILGGTVMGVLLTSNGRFPNGAWYLSGGLVLFSSAIGAGSGHTVRYQFHSAEADSSLKN
jgi:hypothetical protein